jgi:transcriptional regulator with XRE-family HTH domain
MNEKELKMSLRQIAKEGWFICKVTNEFVDSLLGLEYDRPSQELKQRFLSRLRVRIQDAAIGRARRNVNPSILLFGQHVESVREIANLTRAEIAARLGKEVDFVQQIEKGDVSPLRLPPPDVADLLLLFQIKIKDAVQMVNTSLAIARFEQENNRAALDRRGGVRHEHRSGDAEETMEAFVNKLKRRWSRRRSGLSEEMQAFRTGLRIEFASRRRVRRIT